MNECEAIQKLIAELADAIQRLRLEPLPEPPEWLAEALKAQENDD